MDIYILNENFRPEKIINNYNSLIWTERFADHGDFEIEMVADLDIYNYLRYYIHDGTIRNALIEKGRYLWMKDSMTMMVVEKINYKTDPEKGDTMKISGRSFDSVLTRRVFEVTNYYKNTRMRRVILKAIQHGFRFPSPPTQDNVYENLYVEEFDYSKLKNGADDNDGKNPLLNMQITGDTIYDLCKKMTELFDIKVIAYPNLYNGKVYWDKFYPINRTINQNIVKPIIFSYQTASVSESEYNIDISEYSNYIVVAAEGEGIKRDIRKIPRNGTDVFDNPMYTSKICTGLAVFQKYVDARDISKDATDPPLTTSEYIETIDSRGKESFAENDIDEGFEASIEKSGQYEYGKDYFLGDYVTFEDNFGNRQTCQVKEVIFSHDNTGYTIYPTIEYKQPITY